MLDRQRDLLYTKASLISLKDLPKGNKTKHKYEKKGGKMMRNVIDDGVRMNKVNLGNGTASVCWIHFACAIMC